MTRLKDRTMVVEDLSSMVTVNFRPNTVYFETLVWFCRAWVRSFTWIGDGLTNSLVCIQNFKLTIVSCESFWKKQIDLIKTCFENSRRLNISK